MSTVTSKGQVTIPKRVRERLGLQPGDKVSFELDAEGYVRLVNAEAPLPSAPSRFAKVRGTLKTGMTTDEIMKLLRPED